jgi:transcriptional regulator with XRE-family HTH domain
MVLHMDSIDDQFARRLEVALSYNNLNQSGLANKLGITPQALSHIKNGKRPGYERLVEIADALNCSVDWLTRGKGQPPEWLSRPPVGIAESMARDPDSILGLDKGFAAPDQRSGTRAAESSQQYSAMSDGETIKMLVQTNAKLAAQNEQLIGQLTNALEKITELGEQIAGNARFQGGIDDLDAAETATGNRGGESSSVLPAG